LVTGASSTTFAASIFATAFPCSRFDWAPVAVTTISSSAIALAVSAMSTVVVS
jgi:hypothetical protein